MIRALWNSAVWDRAFLPLLGVWLVCVTAPPAWGTSELDMQQEFGNIHLSGSRLLVLLPPEYLQDLQAGPMGAVALFFPSAFTFLASAVFYLEQWGRRGPLQNLVVIPPELLPKAGHAVCNMSFAEKHEQVLPMLCQRGESPLPMPQSRQPPCVPSRAPKSVISYLTLWPMLSTAFFWFKRQWDFSSGHNSQLWVFSVDSGEFTWDAVL